MNTLHHGFWLYFFTRRHPNVWQFVFGAMLPDYIYFVMIGVMLLHGQIGLSELFNFSPKVIMTFLPLHPWAAQIDLLGHSAVVWGLFYLLTMLPALNRLQAFTIGWGSHLLIDGLTHSAYANYYLYPLSLFVAHSPISYWEPEYYAHEFKLVNGTLMALAALYLVCEWWKTKKQ